MPKWLHVFIPIASAAAITGISYGLTESIPLTVIYGVLAGVVAYAITETTSMCSKLEKKINEWELKVLNLQHFMPYLEQTNPYVRDQVDSSLRKLRELVEVAIKGEVVLRAHSIQRDAINLLDRVQSGDVFATSYVNLKLFWHTYEGDLYGQKCFELVQRGVKVTRVFIRPAQADDEEWQCTEDEIAKQKANGVRVKVVLESSLQPECRQDFLLIPDEYVAYLDIGARGDVIKQLRVCFSEEELKTAKELAREIEKFSTEVDERL